ncbi:hypothetical protein C8F04DRAFT_1227643 [Mycena alexandri]|uniref:Uncharacterized protein n=1 Tax=Mycena alexandri TaxID=1745969 RepID=A0AAD6TF50_9AGAR|nr:hypothetical protein C8F04DRAFT_1227643 [Mycena alexandri]
MDQRRYQGPLSPGGGPDLPEPHFRGTKRPAQSTPSRGRPSMQATRTYGHANSGYAHRNPNRASYPFSQPMAPPQGQRQRQFAKQPVRQGFPKSSPMSARRMAPSTAISAPTPVKAAQHRFPHWKVSDDASARASDGRRFAAMSVGSRSTTGSDYRNITDRNFSYANDNVRKDYDSASVGRKAARKVESQDPPSDDESSSSSSESSENESDWESATESDRESETDKPDSEDDSSDDQVQIVDEVPVVIELLDDTPPPSPASTPRLSRPTEDLIAAMEDLTLSMTCLQELRRLPFLRRNLRRGFLNYCRVRGVPIEIGNESPSIAVDFKMNDSAFEASTSCYECPLCHLHFPFQTQEMLSTHLNLDHDEVQATWERLDEDEKWRLQLLFTKTNDLRNVLRHRESESPLPNTIPNPLGPTARFPFLPAKSEYEGPDVNYSVRFGGPKIYDLLGTLPMEKYGVLAWTVLDKEEEIFESDDIPDNHKVMQALWARWIFLNRNLFIGHYLKGTEKFIDEYWKMIRLAAGWDALRYWLMTLMMTGYLAPEDLAALLKRYEYWCTDIIAE